MYCRKRIVRLFVKMMQVLCILLMYANELHVQKNIVDAYNCTQELY